jgi:hypothetical protein
VKAIDGTDIDAVGVFALDAAFGDDMCHRVILAWSACPHGQSRKDKDYKASNCALEDAWAARGHDLW